MNRVGHPNDQDPSSDEFADTTTILRAMKPQDHELLDPPPDLWSRIANEAGVRTTSSSVPRIVGRRASVRRVGIAIAAIAASILAVAIGMQALSNEDDGKVVASTRLVNAGLPEKFDGAGLAQLVRREGHLELDVNVERIETRGLAAGAFYELWLIDTKVEGMVSLGPIGPHAHIELPDSIDPGRYPIVDISVEPTDGVPTHSGKSIVRGKFDT